MTDALAWAIIVLMFTMLYQVGKGAR